MYLRHTVVRKGGRAHTYGRLVRSVRRGRKVVQEAAHLGELDGEGRVRARRLVQAITGRADQRELFEAAPPAEHAVAVRLDRVCVERARAFGDVWLGWTLWRALRLDELCAALLPRGREAIPWARMAAVSVIARLCAPSSELHIAEDWYRTTALEDLLGIATERIDGRRADSAPAGETTDRDGDPVGWYVSSIVTLTRRPSATARTTSGGGGIEHYQGGSAQDRRHPSDVARRPSSVE